MDERFKAKLIVKLMISFVRLEVLSPTCQNVSSEVAQVGPICTGPCFGSPSSLLLLLLDPVLIYTIAL